MEAESAKEEGETCVIFLDIDGVLNRTRGATHIRLDEELVGKLRGLVAESGAKIVLSTFWRGFPDYVEYILARYDIGPGIILGSTPGEPHKGATAFDDKVYASRSSEIEAWLQAHPDVTRFVILDDRDNAALGALQNHFVQTDSRVGLSDADVQRAKEIIASTKYNREL
mmetsp:Transcript_62965/g.150001  ORF Transcript_62965/g.150001 Transcript_62965/m.150001 type:complete len:169 (-) Transcript_62965:58-564(-)